MDGWVDGGGALPLPLSPFHLAWWGTLSIMPHSNYRTSRGLGRRLRIRETAAVSERRQDRKWGGAAGVSGCRKEWEAKKIGNEQTGALLMRWTARMEKVRINQERKRKWGRPGWRLFVRKKGCRGMGEVEGGRSRVWREKERAIRVCWIEKGWSTHNKGEGREGKSERWGRRFITAVMKASVSSGTYIKVFVGFLWILTCLTIVSLRGLAAAPWSGSQADGLVINTRTRQVPRAARLVRLKTSEAFYKRLVGVWDVPRSCVAVFQHVPRRTDVLLPFPHAGIVKSR